MRYVLREGRQGGATTVINKLEVRSKSPNNQ
jgi:hypothetical protein